MITGVLDRTIFTEKNTIGEFSLYENGKQIFHCYTLEDTVRGDGDWRTVSQWKIKGETAIPYGQYKVCLTYSPRFKRNMWELMNVNGFAGVRIHAGNTDKDTEGCILLGKHISPNYTGIVNSRETVQQFETALQQVKEFRLTIGR